MASIRCACSRPCALSGRERHFVVARRRRVEDPAGHRDGDPVRSEQPRARRAADAPHRSARRSSSKASRPHQEGRGGHAARRPGGVDFTPDAPDRLYVADVTRRHQRVRLCAALPAGSDHRRVGRQGAEEPVYGEVSTGAESDLDNATRLARQMVVRWGMSERVGLSAVLPAPGQEHLTPDGAGPAPATRELVDAEVRRILDECYRHR